MGFDRTLLRMNTSGCVYEMCCAPFEVEDSQVPGYKWTKWLDTVPHFEIPRNAAYDAIVVPTIDSIQLTHVMGKLVTAGNHALIFGNTGTGKSIHTAQWLQKEAPETHQSVFVNFSAQTHVNQLQDLIDSKT
ncbi:Dynein heavy chain 1, axonemal, partial [Perkinsus olseni]